MKRAGLRDLMLIALVLCLSALLVSTIYAGTIVPGSVRMTDTPGGVEMTQFASGISVVYLVFDYSDMHNEEFMVRVYNYVGEVLFERSKVYTGSGTESVEVSLAGGGAFPDGRYVTNLYSGLFPISTIIWEVGGAPKIKTFLPCIVKQWLPSVTPTPTRTPAVTTTPSPTPGYDLYEPNDSFSTAYPIFSGETHCTCINPGSDLDYFWFNIQNADYPITVWLTIPDPEKMLYGVDLYDADYNRIDTKANQAGEEAISITHDPAETGRYYVKVYSIQNRFDPSQAYELRVVFDSAPTPTPYRIYLPLALKEFDRGHPPNLLKNPGFEEGFSERGAGEIIVAWWWNPWWIQGSEGQTSQGYLVRPEYKPEDGWIFDMRRVHSGRFAQKYFTTYATHLGDIYQQVAVVEDSLMTFSIWAQVWSSTESNVDQCEGFGNYDVSVGIDPYGGTDGSSGDIIWSDSVRSCNEWVHLSVSTVAQADRVTVFTRGAPEWRVHFNESYWDDAVLTASLSHCGQ